MSYKDALHYFQMAAKEGYYVPVDEEFVKMSEKEIIELAKVLGAEGDYYANEQM